MGADVTTEPPNAVDFATRKCAAASESLISFNIGLVRGHFRDQMNAS